MKKKYKKVVIFIGYSCNNSCGFCINYDKHQIPDKTTDEIIKELYLAKKNKADIIEFVGGEPTLRKDLPNLIAIAKKFKFKKISFPTNGRMLSNKTIAKEIIRSGINEIIISLHAHNPKIHNSLTNSENAFSELMKGIENLKNLKFNNIHGNTIIVKQNVKYLKDIAKLYYSFGITNVEWIYADPTYGGCYKNFNKYVVKISRAAKYIIDMLNYSRKKGIKDFYIRYVPLCYFKDYLNNVSDIKERKIFYKTEHWAKDFINKDVIYSRINISRIKTENCKRCKLYNMCEGIWREYIKRYGDKELKPIL